MDFVEEVEEDLLYEWAFCYERTLCFGFVFVDGRIHALIQSDSRGSCSQYRNID